MGTCATTAMHYLKIYSKNFKSNMTIPLTLDKLVWRSIRENIEWHCSIAPNLRGKYKNGGLYLPVIPVWESRKTVGNGQYFSVLPSKTDRVLALPHKKVIKVVLPGSDTVFSKQCIISSIMYCQRKHLGKIIKSLQNSIESFDLLYQVDVNVTVPFFFFIIYWCILV